MLKYCRVDTFKGHNSKTESLSEVLILDIHVLILLYNDCCLLNGSSVSTFCVVVSP